MELLLLVALGFVAFSIHRLGKRIDGLSADLSRSMRVRERDAGERASGWESAEPEDTRPAATRDSSPDATVDEAASMGASADTSSSTAGSGPEDDSEASPAPVEQPVEAPVPASVPTTSVPVTPIAARTASTPSRDEPVNPRSSAGASGPREPFVPPRLFVLGMENFARLGAWFRENWIYAVAALSLAMAGIFLVQYGVESGVLSPTVRVVFALLLGGLLIGAGEAIRRRGGDDAEDTTAFLPSTFAGAGLVTLFSATLAAHQLYGLIGPQVAFGGLFLVAAGALGLGRVYGNMLSAVGILGATSAPFIVDGSSSNTAWLFYYFALIAGAGLAVDSLKRSAWVSVVAASVPYMAAILIWMVNPGEGAHFLAFASVMALALAFLPSMAVRPVFGGAMFFAHVHQQGPEGWPEFPTRLAAGGVIGLSLVAFAVADAGTPDFWLALAALISVFALLAFWLNRTSTLDDLAAPVITAMLAVIGWPWLTGLLAGPNAVQFVAGTSTTWLTGIALLVSGLAMLKALRSTSFSLAWTIVAAGFAPLVMLIMEFAWKPSDVIGDLGWAFHISIVALVMALFSRSMASHEGDAKLRTSLFVVAALNMAAFAMVAALTDTALTLGLATVVVSAAWLDRRYDIRLLPTFVQAGIILCSFRLLGYPGLPWALGTSLWDFVAGFGGVVGLIGLTWVLLQKRARTEAIIFAESAFWSLAGIFLTLFIYRSLGASDLRTEHWSLGLFAMVWLISSANQFYRWQIDGPLKDVRRLLGLLFAIPGVVFLLGAVTTGSPLRGSLVLGPPLLDSLVLAYALPAALLAFVAAVFTHLDKQVRKGLSICAAGLLVLYAGLEIRRLWQGPDLSQPGVLEGELYSYTMALILLGSAMLVLALLRKSELIRRIAITVIAVAIAKVFLLDMSGLEGLFRVLSFFALGLALAGVALLNRWMVRSLAAETAAAPDAAPDAAPGPE